jgi:preprotein translocase subunit YajC
MKKYNAIYISAAAIILLIVILIILFTNNSEEIVQSNKKEIDKNLLVGDWVRTDAGYLIKIINVNVDGTLEAQYFNPKPINVGEATWEERHGNLTITVVLRDVNYPGSIYTLSYLPDRDILAGDYYQAVQGLNFYVEFARNK